MIYVNYLYNLEKKYKYALIDLCLINFSQKKTKKNDNLSSNS